MAYLRCASPFEQRDLALPPAPQHLPTLTGLRALAAALVLGLHADQNIPVGLGSVLPFFERGHLGVDLFFVLSGFIITYVYLPSLAKPSGRAIGVYLWHRLIRLYPVHLLVLACLAALVILAGMAGLTLNNPEQWRWEDFLWQLTLLHAWGVTDNPGWNAPSWSISAEWFAYLAFPLLAPVLVRVQGRVAALLLAAVVLAGTALGFALAGWNLNNSESHWVGPSTLARVSGEFLCGAALCRAFALGCRPSRPVGDIVGAGALVAFLLGASVGVPDFALVGLLAAAILGAAMSVGLLASVLASRVLVWLGEISYSVYMVHFPILIVARRLLDQQGLGDWPLAARALTLLAMVALVLALAATLFYIVERPARTLLRDRAGRMAPARARSRAVKLAERELP
jgi:peptidoglycan/LPS O-acetylase OafA/YrhL